MMPILYLPKTSFYCVAARYSSDGPNKVKVYNYDNKGKVNGAAHSTNICGTVANASEPAELTVAPCFLPLSLGGPYWVLHFDDDEGLGLISGGQPTKQGPNGCRTGSGENGSGLWIALRTQARNESLIDKGRALLKDFGFDVTILEDVNHEGCTYTPR